jgi:hypothetical protein
MSTVGYGVGGGINLATEGTYGTYAGSGDVSIPFVSESIKAQRAVVEAGSITGDRAVRRRMAGIRSAAGDIVTEVDGTIFGKLLYYWNGSTSGALTSAALSATKGMVTAAATATPSSGGSLVDGTFYYRIGSIWAHTSSGRKLYLPAGSSVSAVCGTGNNTVGLSWSAPSGVPDGFTLHGYAVYRSAAGGANTTCRFLAFVAAGTTTYSDTGSVSSGAAALSTSLYMAGSPYEHAYVMAFTPGTNPLPSFTATVLKDNDLSQRYTGCRMNTMELTVSSDGNAPVLAKFGLMARDYTTVTNISPSVTSLQKFMSWQALASIEGTQSELIEAVTIQGSNNLTAIPGLSGNPRIREVGYGARSVSGTLTRGYENNDFFTRMLNGTAFDIRLEGSGQPWSLTVSSISLGGGVTAYPMEYFAIIDCFNAKCGEAGANVSGPGRMVESIPWSCEVDDTEGTEMRVRLYNLTSSYS